MPVSRTFQYDSGVSRGSQYRDGSEGPSPPAVRRGTKALGAHADGSCFTVIVLAHVSIQCADPAASRAFYEAVLEPLGGKVMATYGDQVGFGSERSGPEFWIGPVNTPGGPHDDVHIAFGARSRAQVDAFVEAARARGAEVLNEPQEWWYRPGYYGGFVRDPDGNNVEAVHLSGP